MKFRRGNQVEEDDEVSVWEVVVGGMFSSPSRPKEAEGGAEDMIEKHRNKKEADYEQRKLKMQSRNSFDSRGDQDEKRNGRRRWGTGRRGNDKDDPKSPRTLDSDEPREQPNSDGSSLTGTKMMVNDTSQRKAMFRQFGGEPLDSIKVEETAVVPTPSNPDEVVVKVMATTVTVHDCLIRRGQDFNLTEPVGLPATSGCDFIGFVSAVGENVTAFKPNDRVAGLLRSGGNARYVQVSQESLVAVPASLDGAEAACMVSVYTSAYQAINLATRESSVYDLEGKQVLVVGGMDGIGQAIIHMCSKANAEVFATAPDRRHAYVRSVLNATPLPENPEEWGTIAKNSMDVVFDGECQGNMDASLSAMNKRGQMICFGNSTLIEEGMGWFGVPVERRLQRMSLESKPRVQVYDIWDNFRKDPDLFKKNLQALFQLLKMRKVKPHIAKRVGLDEVGLSHRKLENGNVRGTVVCLPWKGINRKGIEQPDQEEEA